MEERERFFFFKKGLRMVPYPVDQSQPLSVNVSIGEHTLVCVYIKVCVLHREREEEEGEEEPPACCVCAL